MRWAELKMLEDEKWRSKLAAEERRIALEEQRLEKGKKLEEQRLKLEFEKMAREKEESKCNIKLEHFGSSLVTRSWPNRLVLMLVMVVAKELVTVVTMVAMEVVSTKMMADDCKCTDRL